MKGQPLSVPPFVKPDFLSHAWQQETDSTLALLELWVAYVSS